MDFQDAFNRLDQRRRYLELRIKAKQELGWEWIYDDSERAALAMALEIMKAEKTGS